MLSIFRVILLFPFSLLYKCITIVRNFLYDFQIFKTYKAPILSIGVGNITVGGTGKTPVVDYLIKKLCDYNIGVISRGYGRKTSGLLEIDDQSLPGEVGDEPLMLFKRNKIKFIVSEDRVAATKTILEQYPELSLILYDDVFQHRKIKPSTMILLIDVRRPIFSDFLLPAGSLRESVESLKRADIILFTKSKHIPVKDKTLWITKLKSMNFPENAIFFSYFESESLPVNAFGDYLEEREKVVAVSALADNDSFFGSLQSPFKVVRQFGFRDHYLFKKEDTRQFFEQGCPVVCTEKDFEKIRRWTPDTFLSRLYYLPICLIVENEDFFLDLLTKPKN